MPQGSPSSPGTPGCGAPHGSGLGHSAPQEGLCWGWGQTVLASTVCRPGPHGLRTQWNLPGVAGWGVKQAPQGLELRGGAPTALGRGEAQSSGVSFPVGLGLGASLHLNVAWHPELFAWETEVVFQGTIFPPQCPALGSGHFEGQEYQKRLITVGVS